MRDDEHHQQQCEQQRWYFEQDLSRYRQWQAELRQRLKELDEQWHRNNWPRGY